MTVPHNNLSDNFNSAELRHQITQWATELGFNATGFTRASIGHHEQRLLNWLDNNFHGDMEYMQRHADLRRKPADLHHGTISIISVRMNYLPPQTTDEWSVLEEPTLAYVSRYALGRDYHKLMRKRLQSLAGIIEKHIGPFGYRAFVDSAPVMEKALAEQAGLGWIGKHSNLLSRDAGSWFFLGELYTDLPLHTTPQKTDSTTDNHCGSCSACIDICPTQAIVEPYVVDARRCVSYLTIELRTSIPTELRHLIGNRIYGCDDCQLVCPWNKFLQHTCEKDFSPRHDLDCASLIELFNWSEAEFNERTLGSAIRRIGYDCWQRNIAVAMGNAPYNEQLVQALHARLPSATEMVQEHIQWALDQHTGKQ
jgi:epoxyqueuosine reductase